MYIYVCIYVCIHIHMYILICVYGIPTHTPHTDWYKAAQKRRQRQARIRMMVKRDGRVLASKDFPKDSVEYHLFDSFIQVLSTSRFCLSSLCLLSLGMCVLFSCVCVCVCVCLCVCDGRVVA